MKQSPFAYMRRALGRGAQIVEIHKKNRPDRTKLRRAKKAARQQQATSRRINRK